MKSKAYLLFAVVVILFVVGWTGYGQKQGSKKQVWEYKSVYDRSGGFQGEKTFNELGYQWTHSRMISAS